MAKSEDLSTDWQKSAGDFSCTVCQRKRLPASEFSKKQVAKALESLRSIPDKDVRTGPDIHTVTYLSGVCKKCAEEKEQTEKAAAEAKREEREKAAGEAVIEAPERVEVSFDARPFGMTPATKGNGYVVLKASDGKPAAKAGVRPGWRLVAISGESCESLDMNGAQAKLKAADLPVTVLFEAVPGGADFCVSCQEVLAMPLFSRKMRTKPPEKRRCSSCVEASEADGEAAEGEVQEQAGGYSAPEGSKLSELQQLCA
eukprot:CAMPEP_0197672684 /NCGR_PEP_ID=MMETSP1338-20131121/79463_1 /TAXON_ID=43686 ORGANISM="Pelagodinium beii, Strain RCC1491" /NCGR_SAMPLE_ID=MMETSP1338 /ASSEMBLY_ACC=CAM_ASM_000754 /LENGTH=256 /DNA_ID=CAMNT_0043252819 /DNA_START=24 /DNA_END=791 /DNA_ORIENTATION=+